MSVTLLRVGPVERGRAFGESDWAGADDWPLLVASVGLDVGALGGA